ncbi:MAG: APC family permease [bacterium]|nr:APC family permease [bacterium]
MSAKTVQDSDRLWLGKLKRGLFGGRLNPFDPKVFQHVTLIAFFAWVGMGADGISSASYGPEEAFHALRGFSFLMPALAALIAATVLIISAAYSQLIEQFPNGGGGYVAASKLLHPNAGPVAGSALIIDYVLTIAVSVVSGVDALFSLLPPHWDSVRMYAVVLIIVFLVWINLRGVKESVLTLLPVFMVFVVSHVLLVGYGLVSHIGSLPERIAESHVEAHSALSQFGLLFVLIRLLHGFSMGAGTLTGIEAVSNGMLALKEPRVQTGKRTMFYMAISLAYLAAFLMVNYYLFRLEPEHGKTLNAALFTQITAHWTLGGVKIGSLIVGIMMVSAALLLFVAAQTGFIGGPRVLSSMAEDSWLPHRFGHLSERLVTRNGILMMGLAAIAFILYARGHLSALIAIYAINVFIGFTMALLGMSRLWWRQRRTSRRWLRKLTVCGLGFAVSAALLAIMIAMKFSRGGWFVLLVTGALIFLCFRIHAHYRMVAQKTKKLDEILVDLPFGEETVTRDALSPTEPTAVVLVQGYTGQSLHLLLNIHRLFSFHFKQYIFVSVGTIDSGTFKGVSELAALRKAIDEEASRLVTLTRSYGLRAEAVTGYAIDYLSEIERFCLEVHQKYPKAMFFAGRLLFWKDTLWNRLLHNETPLALQRRLMFHGLQFVVLPIRLQ